MKSAENLKLIFTTEEKVLQIVDAAKPGTVGILLASYQETADVIEALRRGDWPCGDVIYIKRGSSIAFSNSAVLYTFSDYKRLAGFRQVDYIVANTTFRDAVPRLLPLLR